MNLMKEVNAMTVVRPIAVNELELLLQLFDYNDPNEMLVENTEKINDGSVEIFGLFRGDRLIGELHAAYVSDDERFAVRGKRAYLFAFRVHNDFQGQGCGQLLMNEVISTLQKKGYSEFTIGVEDDNEPAKHIYTKLGFSCFVAGLREEYQGDTYEYSLYLRG